MDQQTSPSHDRAPESGSLLQLLLILRRRWRLLAVIWGTTISLGAIYTFTTPKLFRPQAALEIRPEMPLLSTGDSNDPAFMASKLNYENYYRTQEQILTSPTLLDSAFKALPQAIRVEYDKKPDPLKAFSEKVDIEKVRSSYILKVGFVDESAERATQVVNTIISLYLEDTNRHLRDLKSGAVEVLTKETLPSMRAKVEEADRKLQEFQKAAGFMDFEEHYKLLIERYRKYDACLTELGLKKRRIQAGLLSLGSYGADGVSGLFNPAFHLTRSLEPLAEQRARILAELAKQEKQLLDKHPAVLELRAELRVIDERIKEAIRGSMRALETDLAEVESEEKGIREDLAIVAKSVEEVGGQKFRYRQLEAELAGSKDLYSSYLKKHGETTATSGSALGSVRIVDHATVPILPFKPRPAINLALAAFVGLCLGFCAIFLVDQVDDRIDSPREVEAFIGLDVLALIPKLSEPSRDGSPVLLGSESSLLELETFRGLRAELLTRIERLPRSKVIAVLSAMQSEGKSTVSANLAAVLAMEQRKVLVLDADLRRPSIIRLLGKDLGGGLPAVLRGELQIAEAIQKSKIPGVDVLGAREGVSAAAELIGSPRFDECLRYARENYDLVIIDSAPVNQVSESALVARKADGVIFVIREHQTSRGAAIQARKRLVGMGVNLLGAAVNCARSQGNSYGYYYAYERG